ncbi:hypothetical protein VBD025_14730 [Virgibacillus flavescens]|uniref:hypothetical protein n=1 Tax=Virgibacillus flavescens TaxID=1611422 RepID=UPI003D340A01
MNKVYLSVIALLCLVLLFQVFKPAEDDATSMKVSTHEVSLNNDQLTNQKQGNQKEMEELFREYFSNVTPKKDFFKNRIGVAIHEDEIPEEDRKAVAAAHLLKAREAVLVDRKIGIPTLENFYAFFVPTDQQLVKLMKDTNSILATNIKQKAMLIEQSSELIENKQLKEYLKSISVDLINSKIYEQDSLFEFSLGYNNYSNKVKRILELTQYLS